jgi:hypothetical protein
VTPVRFAQSNTVFKAPPGMDNCFDIHAAVVQWGDKSTTVLTAWKPSPEELVKLNLGEPVFLSVCGITMPPVAVLVGNPIEES